MNKVLITTAPFGEQDPYPLKLLEMAGVDYAINPYGRKLSEHELAELIPSFDVLIAGTEKITEKVMEKGSNLKFISRVGIGLDSVDLHAAKRRGIQVSFTPDAPSPAVAELTVCLMLTLLRSVHLANSAMHRGIWKRYFGRRLAEVTLGLIGAGRIGRKVIEIVSLLGARTILVNDIRDDLALETMPWVKTVTKEEIYKNADLISVHVPLTRVTSDMIRYDQLLKMKKEAMIINTSRGGIVNEEDLARVLHEGHLMGAAVDVFDKEPYDGELRSIERCILTSHMGSMSFDCRSRMEIEATEEAIRFLNGQPLKALVPQHEYDAQ